MTGRALDGITVVSVEQAVAGPLASRHLGDLGARVIKVERPDGGDFARSYDDVVHGLSAHFVGLNRNKESIALDLTTDGGRSVLDDLVARADVLIQNLAPGSLARLGFGTEALRARHPSLVVAEISGYGTGGPLSGKRAYDLLVQGESGIVSVNGTAEQMAKVAIPIVDIATGMYAFSGILAALVRRGRTGEGDTVSVAMIDAAVEWMSYPLTMAAYGGAPLPRTGLAHPGLVPYDGYLAADGVTVLIGVQNDRGWRTLATEVLEQPALADDARYATNAARVARREEVDTIVGEAARRWASADLVERLDRAGVPAALVNDSMAVLAHPHLAERDRWRAVESPGGEVRAALPPWIGEGPEPRMDPVPALGQHTNAILAELGRTDEIESLRRSGAVA